MAYDTTKAFCTEQQVFDIGGFIWTATGTPNATAVEGFAYDKASEIVEATQAAGRRIEPPTSGISNVHLGRVLAEANAKGAAYEAWRVMASKTPDDFAIAQRDQLRTDWLSFIGFYNSAGERVRGRIEIAIESAIRARVIDNDVTGGETQLPAHDSEERPYPFTMTDRL